LWLQTRLGAKISARTLADQTAADRGASVQRASEWGCHLSVNLLETHLDVNLLVAPVARASAVALLAVGVCVRLALAPVVLTTDWVGSAATVALASTTTTPALAVEDARIDLHVRAMNRNGTS
jgi:hypothetical protein